MFLMKFYFTCHNITYTCKLYIYILYYYIYILQVIHILLDLRKIFITLHIVWSNQQSFLLHHFYIHVQYMSIKSHYTVTVITLVLLSV